MCGLVGIVSRENNAVPMNYIGLGQLQHRGKDSAGMATAHLKQINHLVKGPGEVINVFNKDVLSRMHGTSVIGHVRYGTAGKRGTIDCAQPIRGVFRKKYPFCLGHNGNTVNKKALFRELHFDFSCVDTMSDTQLVVELLSNSRCVNFEDALIDVAKKLQGAFNFLVLFGDTIYALTDRFGFHPLMLGKIGNDYIIASESCVLDHLGGQHIGDIEPGVLLSVNHNGTSSAHWSGTRELHFDIFEYVYFARPDSIIWGVEVGTARRIVGMILADEHPLYRGESALVVPVPDSGMDAAWGYAEGLKRKRSGVTFDPNAIVRSHTVSRTFTDPVEAERGPSVHLKLNMRKPVFSGKDVILVDDSIVRANTMKIVVERVRNCGAKSVSAVIASPMCKYPDIYGIDTNQRPDELVASRMKGETEHVRDECGLDYLGFVSLEGMISGVLAARSAHSPLRENSFYLGTFTGEYPDGTGDEAEKISAFTY
ncbi:MAG: amidophosphoribosyltransferase [bacterium]|nr:amidophosphoribosyltransferase [bacterium]